MSENDGDCFDLSVQTFSPDVQNGDCSPSRDPRVEIELADVTKVLKGDCLSEDGGTCDFTVCKSQLLEGTSINIRITSFNDRLPFLLLSESGREIAADGGCPEEDECQCGGPATNFIQCDGSCGPSDISSASFNVLDPINGSSSSGATYAIVIVNAIVGVAFIVGIIFWWRRRETKFAKGLSGDATDQSFAVIVPIKPGSRAKDSVYLRSDMASAHESAAKEIANGSQANSGPANDQRSVATVQSKENLRTKFVSFSSSRKESQLSDFLMMTLLSSQTHKNKKKKAARKITIATEISAFEIGTLKTAFSRSNTQRSERMRKESIKYAGNRSQVNSMMGFTSLRRRSGAWKRKNLRELIDDVCATLKGQILTVAEVIELRKRKRVNQLIDVFPEVPPISLENYLLRLTHGINKWFYDDEDIEIAGTRALLMSLVYLEKIKFMEKDFVLTEFNVHRLFATMMLVAVKFSEDEPIYNDYWAQVAGVDVEEINELEDLFCFSSGFNFFITPREMSVMYTRYGLSFLNNMLRRSVDTSFSEAVSATTHKKVGSTLGVLNL